MMPYDKAGRTDFEESSFQEVVEAFLYTSDSMFGDIQHDAAVELSRRLQKLFPPPDWAKKHWFPEDQDPPK